MLKIYILSTFANRLTTGELKNTRPATGHVELTRLLYTAGAAPRNRERPGSIDAWPVQVAQAVRVDRDVGIGVLGAAAEEREDEIGGADDADQVVAPLGTRDQQSVQPAIRHNLGRTWGQG